MIGNIIDNRSNQYDIHVDVIYEPSWADNNHRGATQFPIVQSSKFIYEWAFNITVEDAIRTATNLSDHVTVHLYDAGYIERHHDDIRKLNQDSLTRLSEHYDCQ